MAKSRTFKPQEELYEHPLKARADKGWTRIRNYGKGSSTLKIEYGKRLGDKLWRKQMVVVKGKIGCDKCGNDTDFKLILNATNLKEIIRYA